MKYILRRNRFDKSMIEVYFMLTTPGRIYLAATMHEDSIGPDVLNELGDSEVEVEMKLVEG